MMQSKIIAPYLRGSDNLQSWGISMTTALLPITAATVYMQGAVSGIYQAIDVFINILLVCAIFIGVELLFVRILADKKREIDFFTFADGLAVAFVLPSNLPRLYIVAIAFLMAFLGKQIFEVRFNFFISFSQLAKFISLCVFPAYFWREQIQVDSNLQFLSFLRLLVGENAVTMGDSCVIALCVGSIYLCLKKWPRIYIVYMIIGLLFVGYCILFPKELSLVQLADFFFSDGLLFAILFCGTNPKAVPASFNGQLVCAVCVSSIILIGKWLGFGQICISLSFVVMNLLMILVYHSEIILYFRRRFVWKG